MAVPGTGPSWEGYRDAVAGEALPLAWLDAAAFEANRLAVLRRAGTRPVRLATKSIRVRALLRSILASDARFRGLMCFSAREAAWLAGHWFDDLLVAYPTLARDAVDVLAAGGSVDGAAAASRVPPTMLEQLVTAGHTASAAGIGAILATSAVLAGGGIVVLLLLRVISRPAASARRSE